MTSVRISRTYTVQAAHFLPNVPPGHKCGRMHGHTYTVKIELRCSVGAVSCWGVDFAEVDAAWAAVFGELDHRLLNEIPGLENPTSEVLASWVAQSLAPGFSSSEAKLSAVEVSENGYSSVRLEVGHA